MLDNKRRYTGHVLSEELSVPKTTIHRILTEDLNMRKVNAVWVPRLLTFETFGLKMVINSRSDTQKKEIHFLPKL